MRILLVEDNEANRDMLGRRLARRGYAVAFAADGEAGIASVLADKPDLVLMDIDLPKVSGWDATRAIRGHYALEELPIIALTAHAMALDRQKSFEAGCNEYEAKPINFASLVEKIELLTARRGAA
ncbi:MAG: response regulator [Rhodospirillales bacterium]